MSLFALLKLVHMTCAYLSVAGFTLRGFWMMTGNPRLRRRTTRILPHTIDTLLLATAVGMLWLWGISPLEQDWLSAKLFALLAYIGLGMVALRFGRTRRVRVTACLLALCCAAYMLSVAYTKSPLGLLELV